MKNQASQLRWNRLCVLVFVICCTCATFAFAATGTQQISAADLVILNSVSDNKTPELPNAVFPHSKHTQAFNSSNCKACHNPIAEKENTSLLPLENSLSFSFMNTRAIPAHELQNYYHESCITCHKEMVGAGEKSGPLNAFCRNCHDNSYSVAKIVRPETNFYSNFHDLHMGSDFILPQKGHDTNCSTCHTSYVDGKHAPYEAGDETSCKTCHLPNAEFAKAVAENPEKSKILPLGKVSHVLCVNCHMQTPKKDANAKTGPIDCAGCHNTN